MPNRTIHVLPRRGESVLLKHQGEHDSAPGTYATMNSAIKRGPALSGRAAETHAETLARLAVRLGKPMDEVVANAAMIGQALLVGITEFVIQGQGRNPTVHHVNTGYAFDIPTGIEPHPELVESVWGVTEDLAWHTKEEVNRLLQEGQIAPQSADMVRLFLGGVAAYSLTVTPYRPK